MRILPLLLCLLLLPVMTIAATTSDPAAFREQEMTAQFDASNKACLDYMTEFGMETNKQFEIQKELAIKEIHSELVKLKVTLAVTLFAALAAALWFFEIVHRRRLRYYDKLTKSFAEDSQRRSEKRSPEAKP